MKRINSIFFAAAAAALSLVSCSQENLAPTEKPQGELVTVHFGAESGIASSTKATLTTEDEATFTSAWENGDVLSVEFLNGQLDEGVVPAEWAGSYFKAVLPGFHGDWEYDALYPAPSSTGAVDFGSNRTQNGNEYNSHYDLMFGNASAKNATAGKDDSGKDIIFEMNRQTAIAYFHLTSGLDEEVVSATLSVEGDVAAIASSVVMPIDYKKGFDLSVEDLKSITITYEEGTAPKATDLKLWFNVLPTVYDKMTLTVETTGHTMSISRTSKEDTYEAGKLYKVVKTIPTDKWVEKTPVVKDNTYSLISSDEDLTDGLYLIGMAMNTDLNTIQYLENGKKVKPAAIAVTDGLSISQDKTTVTVDPQTVSNVQWLLEHVDGGVSITSYADETLGLGTTTANDGLTTQSSYAGEPWTISSSDNSSWIFKFNATNRYLNVYSLSNPRTYNSASTNSKGKIFLYRYNGQIAQKYGISCAENIEGGSVEADASRAVEGKEITLTYSAETGYEFKAWDVKDSDGASVAVSADGKFTMPAKDVKVSAVFTKIEYKIEKENAEHGSFTVKVNGEEATVANYGDEITLDATSDEGYSFDNWTVTDEAKKTVSVSNNKFTMPAAGVSISAKFIQSTFASLEELVASGRPTSAGRNVTVTLSDEVIDSFKNPNLGVFINVATSNGNSQKVVIYCSGRPTDWTVDGMLSGTLKDCKWSYTSSEWRLSPNNYNELTYTPAPVINCEDVTVEAGATERTLTYSIDNPLDGAAASVEVDGSVVTSAVVNASAIDCVISPNTTTSTRKGSVTIKYAHVSKTVSITQEANTLSVDQNTKTWASDATDEFVIKVEVNNGASWTVSPESLDWATVSVDNAAGTIKVKPNGENKSGAAYEGKLTVTHDQATSLYETISLKQLQAGAALAETATLDASYLKDNRTNGKFNEIVSYTNSSSNPTGSELRVHKGAVLSIVAATGYSIQKVEFTCTANVGKQYGFYTDSKYVTVDNGATALSTGSGNVGTITITGKTSKVEYKATANQMRVTKMVVTYIKD